MFMPEVEENLNTRDMISQWRGYNHNYSIGMGEFYDMENMTCDDFPIMMARDVRPTLLNALHMFRGILYTDSALAYLDGNTFHYKSWMLDLTPLFAGEANVVEYDPEFEDHPEEHQIIWSDQTLIRFGTFVLIFPLKVWVDINARSAGLIESHFEAATGKTITYTISKQDGSDYQNVVAQTTAPTNPSEGDYWLNTTSGSEGLNVYLDSSWQPVPTTYIRIELTGANFDDYFEVGDAINLNSVAVPDINNGSIIQAISSNYIVVLGLLTNNVSVTETTSSGWTLEITRIVPTLDYICSDKNRLWGCRYGYDSHGNLINEIYASKLGDFKNWQSFQGLATDSYTATIGVPGVFTGCISYGGYPTFFKETAIIRVSGNYPAEYNVMQMDARGVQDGSSKSLAIVDEALYYKAPGGVMVFDGSLPRLISEEFGRNVYHYDGIAGVGGSKYYLEVTNPQGGHRMFVYNTQLGIWTKESPIRAEAFSGANDGRLFCYTHTSIFGLGLTDNELYTNKQVGEEYVSWFLETGDMGLETPEFKRISKLTFRAYIPTYSEISVDISYDDKIFEHVGDIRGFQETMTHVLHLTPYRCDHFRLKLTGHGRVRFYSLVITSEAESDEYEYKN